MFVIDNKFEIFVFESFSSFSNLCKLSMKQYVIRKMVKYDFLNWLIKSLIITNYYFLLTKGVHL